MEALIDMPERVSTERHELQDTGNNQGRDASSRGDVLMKRILENMSSTPWDELLRKIECSSDIRRGKVLCIRRQIEEGTYEIEDRVDGAIDRVLEAVTA